jgi:type IV secretory pathway VirB2 component (pilin)
MRRLLWPLLVLAAAVAIVTVAFPTMTIHPFRPQTGRGVAWSYALKRAAPVVTGIGLAIVLACAAMLWVGARRWWRRGAIVLLVVTTGLATWFARQNHFEWMFNPLTNAEYASVADARAFLVDAEIVMGIDVNGASIAYPIRQLAYHHVVNEVVAGTPLAATY